MLNEAVYQQGLATGGDKSGSQPQQPQPAAGSQRHLAQYANLNGSSSGVTSTGSNTPNSIQGQSGSGPGVRHLKSPAGPQQGPPTHQHPHHLAAAGHHAPPLHLPHLMQVGQGPHMHQRGPTFHGGPPPLHPNGAGPPPLHLHPHAHHVHQTPHQAAAAAVAAAAIMANSGDPSALMYHAQQYHEFQQYAAAMAAAQAASDYQSSGHLTPGAALAQALAAAAYRAQLGGESAEHHQAAHLPHYTHQQADEGNQGAPHDESVHAEPANGNDSGMELASQSGEQHCGPDEPNRGLFHGQPMASPQQPANMCG